MHIVQYNRSIIPPVAYGGVPRISFWLTREYVRRGYCVTLMAHPLSKISEVLPQVNFIPLPDDIDDYRRLIPKDADIIHFHWAPPNGLLPDIPFIVTEHGNRRHFKNYAPNTVFVSQSHAENHHGPFFVYNGIPIEEYPFATTKSDFMLFLAKLDWRAKNAKTAIQLSLDNAFHLKLAGGFIKESRKIWGLWLFRYYFQPHLIDNIGMVAGNEKLNLLSQARVLFYMVNWQEPFGIAIHEALACGTPVLGSPNGAITEFIKAGVNGYLPSNYKEASRDLKKIKSMTPSQILEMAENCRQSAFSIVDTADNYIKLYEKIIDRGELYPRSEAEGIFFDRPKSIVIKKSIWPS